ncbi:MAG: nuclear transport factor 2 family protein [Chloroflexota bacterium]|nr:nuclear transport factor 2 family protein [Chloroflexota bacterium]
MSQSEQERVLRVLAEVISTHDWDRLGDAMHQDGILEYPQSGERFRGLANIRAQFENYPGLGPGTSQLADVIGGESYALTPSYTVIRVEGSGQRGAAVVRVRYPDQSLWWALNLFELQDGRIIRSRSYFAPDFEAPAWRAPYREAP